jgi:putative glutamine amidotransferase
VSGEVLVSATYATKAEPYVEALRAAGVPADDIRVLLPEDRGSVRELAAGAVGLVLSGGADIDPLRYGEEPLANGNLELKPDRDELDWQLLEAARARRLPTWCVCRGLQVANVFLGGSLYQDLPLQLPGALAHDLSPPPDALVHAVEATDAATALGSRLAGGLRLVNSRHHQAVRELGRGLVAVATSRDGLIEAAELADGSGWWLRGVQWHPENLIALAEQRVLWDDFAAALRP